MSNIVYTVQKLLPTKILACKTYPITITENLPNIRTLHISTNQLFSVPKIPSKILPNPKFLTSLILTQFSNFISNLERFSIWYKLYHTKYKMLRIFFNPYSIEVHHHHEFKPRFLHLLQVQIHKPFSSNFFKSSMHHTPTSSIDIPS